MPSTLLILGTKIGWCSAPTISCDSLSTSYECALMVFLMCWIPANERAPKIFQDILLAMTSSFSRKASYQVDLVEEANGLCIVHGLMESRMQQ